jgi:hypothetical protein
LSQALSGKGEHELSTYDSNFNVAHVKSFNDSIDTAEANLDVEEVVRAGHLRRFRIHLFTARRSIRWRPITGLGCKHVPAVFSHDLHASRIYVHFEIEFLMVEVSLHDNKRFVREVAVCIHNLLGVRGRGKNQKYAGEWQKGCANGNAHFSVSGNPVYSAEEEPRPIDFHAILLLAGTLHRFSKFSSFCRTHGPNLA